MITYIVLAIIIAIVSIFSFGKLNKKHKLATNDEDKAGLVFMIILASAVWPFSLVILVIVGTLAAILIGASWLFHKAEK